MSRPAPARFSATNVPLRSLILNRSGVTGEFDIALQFAPTNVDSSGTSIFTAIQEQLGLKLQPANGPVDVVVVERVERATEN